MKMNATIRLYIEYYRNTEKKATGSYHLAQRKVTGEDSSKDT